MAKFNTGSIILSTGNNQVCWEKWSVTKYDEANDIITLNLQFEAIPAGTYDFGIAGDINNDSYGVIVQSYSNDNNLLCELGFKEYIHTASTTCNSGDLFFNETITLPKGSYYIAVKYYIKCTVGSIDMSVKDKTTTKQKLFYDPKPSIVSATTTKIGKNPTFSIQKMDSNAISTLTYQFGSLSGTIIENYSDTSYNSWTIPVSFYEQIPNAKSGTCTITCTSYIGTESIGSTTSTFTVEVDEDVCKPTMSATIIDTEENIVAITGSNTCLVKGYSTALVTINDEAKYGATIVKRNFNNLVLAEGNNTVTIPKIGETGVLTLVAKSIDSRGLFATYELTDFTYIPYSKVTCSVDAEMPTTSGTWKFTIKGSYYNQAIGATTNTLSVKYRYAANNDDYGEWIDADVTKYTDGTFIFNVNLSGLDYRNMYRVQAYAADRLSQKSTDEIRVRATPIFEWDNDDFTFNVPVNADVFNAESINVSGNSVFEGNVTINGTLTADLSSALSMADKVFNYTTTTNSFGTWYIRQWESGYVECWGKSEAKYISNSGATIFSCFFPVNFSDTDYFITTGLTFIDDPGTGTVLANVHEKGRTYSSTSLYVSSNLSTQYRASINVHIIGTVG